MITKHSSRNEETLSNVNDGDSHRRDTENFDGHAIIGGHMWTPLSKADLLKKKLTKYMATCDM